MSKFGRVLIVEDDPTIIDLLEALLQDEGIETKSALGEIALKLAEEFEPDVILLDIMMPVMDGLEWSNLLKSNPKLKSIPIIVLSAASSDILKTNYKNLQASSFVAKPFDIERLINLVFAFLNLRGNLLLSS